MAGGEPAESGARAVHSRVPGRDRRLPHHHCGLHRPGQVRQGACGHSLINFTPPAVLRDKAFGRGLDATAKSWPRLPGRPAARVFLTSALDALPGAPGLDLDFSIYSLSCAQVPRLCGVKQAKKACALCRLTRAWHALAAHCLSVSRALTTPSLPLLSLWRTCSLTIPRIVESASSSLRASSAIDRASSCVLRAPSHVPVHHVAVVGRAGCGEAGDEMGGCRGSARESAGRANRRMLAQKMQRVAL